MVRSVVRHSGEINEIDECVGWIVALQFCFDGWLFLVDGCSFFFFLLVVG